MRITACLTIIEKRDCQHIAWNLLTSIWSTCHSFSLPDPIIARKSFLHNKSLNNKLYWSLWMGLWAQKENQVLGLDKVKYVLYFYLIKRDIIHLNISLYLIVIVIYVYWICNDFQIMESYCMLTYSYQGVWISE